MASSDLTTAVIFILIGLAGMIVLLRVSYSATERQAVDDLKRARKRLSAAVQRARDTAEQTANVRAAMEGIAQCTKILRRSSSHESQCEAALATIEKSAAVLSGVIAKKKKAGELAHRRPRLLQRES